MHDNFIFISKLLWAWKASFINNTYWSACQPMPSSQPSNPCIPTGRPSSGI